MKVSYEEIDLNVCKQLVKELNETEYPVRISQGKETLDTLEREFVKYRETLEKHVEDLLGATMYDSICELMNALKKIHEDYLEGRFLQAYSGINDVVRDYKDDLNVHNLVEQNMLQTGQIWYRSRTVDSHITLKSDEMFHIPYAHRDRVGSNRFSAPGIPCLYLGSSSYICWLEAGRPAYNTFNVTAFYSQKELAVLDLSCMPQKLVNEIGRIQGWGKNLCGTQESMEKWDAEKRKTIDLLNRFAFTWPLALACGIKVKDHGERSRQFKEEYIIPQLLIQTLTQNAIDGIQYISTNIYFSVREDQKSYFINCAFPAKGKDNMLSEYLEGSSVLNASSCQGIGSLRNDVNRIVKHIKNTERATSNSLFGINNAKTSTSSLPNEFGGAYIPYAGGNGRFSYRDSVFGEMDETLKKDIFSTLHKKAMQRRKDEEEQNA